MFLRKNAELGLSYVFNSEEKAIILEDDTLPSISFFNFDDLLKRYENNKVSMITGSNFKTQITLNLKDDYFFLNILVFGVGQHGKIDGIYYLITK